MEALAWFGVAFSATWIGTSFARRYALRRNLLDQPGARRNHVVAMPRGGGIAMLLVMIGLAWVLAFRDASQRVPMMAAASSFALVGGIGWWDDHRPLPVVMRLAVHCVASLCIVLAGWAGGWTPWSWVAGMGLALVLINFWNFMDGIDGIAASQALLCAFFISLLLARAGDWHLFSLVVAGAAAGFLVWNFPKARIFMGDVGSGVLGLAVAWLWTRTTAIDATSGVLVLFVLGPFMMDAAMTLLRRMWRRERWWEAHSTHAYQLLARHWVSHIRVTVLYAGLNLLGGGLALMLRDVEQPFIVGALGAWYMALAIMWWMARASTMQEPRRSR